MISPERLYLTADKSTVVKDGDPRASFLLVGAGCELDDATARQYGIGSPAPEPVTEPVAELSSDASADPPKPDPPKAPAFKPNAK